MGTVEMITPAMGMKPQTKTKSDSRPTPGSCSAHMPTAVRMVFTAAMRACRVRGGGWGAGQGAGDVGSMRRSAANGRRERRAAHAQRHRHSRPEHQPAVRTAASLAGSAAQGAPPQQAAPRAHLRLQGLAEEGGEHLEGGRHGVVDGRHAAGGQALHAAPDGRQVPHHHEGQDEGDAHLHGVWGVGQGRVEGLAAWAAGRNQVGRQQSGLERGGPEGQRGEEEERKEESLANCWQRRPPRHAAGALSLRFAFSLQGGRPSRPGPL